MSKQTCAECRYFKANPKSGATNLIGHCRRNPPSFGDKRWPYTAADDWCGEFSAVPEQAPELGTPAEYLEHVKRNLDRLQYDFRADAGSWAYVFTDSDKS